MPIANRDWRDCQPIRLGLVFQPESCNPHTMPIPRHLIQADHREPKLLFGCIVFAVSLLTMPLPTMDSSAFRLSDHERSALSELSLPGESSLARSESARGGWHQSNTSGTPGALIALPRRSFTSEAFASSTRSGSFRTLVALGVRLQV